MLRSITARLTLTLLALLIAACGGEGKKDPRLYTMGLVTNNLNGLRNIQGFRLGMKKLGYVEGENVKFVFEGSPTKGDALNEVLDAMVEKKVDLIFTAGTPTGVAAHRITRTNADRNR